MELSREVRFSLPRHVNINRIGYHVKLPSGLSSPMGETHLLSHHGRLVVLTRNKMTDSLAPVGMSASHPPRLLHEEWQDILLLRGDANQRYRIPLPNASVGPVAYLLEETKGQPPETLTGDDATDDATGDDVETTEDGEPADGDGSAPDGFPLIVAPEPTPDLELVPTDPDSVLDAVGVFLRAGKVQLASTWARTVPEMSMYHGAEAREAIGVIDALERGEVAEAFLRTELSDFLRAGIHDGAVRPIADAFAQRGELVWAGAALMAALDDVDDARLAQVFQHLGKNAAREEHHDWLLSELDSHRTELISKKILENRSDASWRELRARLAVRRGGHGLALRELKLLAERFPGQAGIEAARLRALWDSHQRPLFDKLLERLSRDFADDLPGLMHLTRMARELGGSSAQLSPFVRRLAELAPADPVVGTWAAELGSGAGGQSVLWIALGAGSVAVAATLLLLF